MFKITKVYEESNNLEVEDTEYGTMEVNLKWDGCINLWIGSNGIKPSEATPEERELHVDYLHICDIDEFIEQLQEIKRIGQEHFDNEYW